MTVKARAVLIRMDLVYGIRSVSATAPTATVASDFSALTERVSGPTSRKDQPNRVIASAQPARVDGMEEAASSEHSGLEYWLANSPMSNRSRPVKLIEKGMY